MRTDTEVSQLAAFMASSLGQAASNSAAGDLLIRVQEVHEVGEGAVHETSPAWKIFLGTMRW